MNIEAAYCINLADRSDRWANVKKQFELYFDGCVEHFEAVKMAPGWKGCRASHLKLLEKCKHLDEFMILEDDVQFVGKAGEVLQKAYEQLPDDWDVLYLGAHLQGPIKKYSDNLCRLQNAFCTHAMIFNNRRHIVNYILDNQHLIEKIDVFYLEYLMPTWNIFITNPLTATQADSYSDIINRSTAYSKLFIEKFNQNIIE